MPRCRRRVRLKEVWAITIGYVACVVEPRGSAESTPPRAAAAFITPRPEFTISLTSLSHVELH